MTAPLTSLADIETSAPSATKPDVPGMSKRVSSLLTRLDQTSDVGKDHSKLDLVPWLQELSDVLATANTVVTDVRGWYEYHDQGLLRALARGLREAANRLLVIVNQAPVAQQNTKVGPILTKVADSQTQLAQQLDRVASDYDYASQLPQKLSRLLPEWFAVRLPDPIPFEQYHLLHRMGNQLKMHMEQYAARAKGGDAKQMATYGKQAEAAVLAADLVKPFLPPEMAPGTISKGMSILDDTEFCIAYVKDFAARNRDLLKSTNTPFWRALPVSEVDNVLGFYHDDAIFLRSDGDLSTCVHEALHLLSDQLTGNAWQNELGLVLEEAAAEYLCGRICKQHGIEFELGGYYNNVTLLTTIMKRAKITDKLVDAAYLGGKTGPVVAAIKAISGEPGLKILRESRDRTGYDTYYAWVEQHKTFTKKTDNDWICHVM